MYKYWKKGLSKSELEWRDLEEVDSFKYLEPTIGMNQGVDEDVNVRVYEDKIKKAYAQVYEYYNV